MMNFKLTLACSAVVMAFASPWATAETVSLDYTGAAYPNYKSGTIYSDFDFVVGDTSLESKSGVAAGGFNMIVGSEDSSQFATGQSIVAWCVDIHHTLVTKDPQWVSYAVGDTTKLAGDFSQARVDKLQSLVNQRYSLVDTARESAAFQLAIWEIMFENLTTYDLDEMLNNTFKSTDFDTAKALAEDWLQLKGNNTGNYKITYLYDADRTNNPNSQNLITMSPVPLPAAGILMLSALGLGGMMRKLRSGKATT